MSSLSVGGVEIPVAPEGVSRDRDDATDRTRAFDLTYRASVTGTPKRDWTFSTPPIPRQTADFYEGILTRVPAQSCSGDILGGSQNLLLYSEQADNAAWGKTSVTVSADFALAPTGLMTTDRIVETAVTSQHYIDQAVTGLTTNGTYTLSAYLHASQRTWAYLFLIGKDAAARLSYFDLALGVVGSSSGGSVPSIESVPSADVNANWFRASIVASAGAGGSTPLVGVGIATGDTVPSYLGNVANGIFVWGAQLEEASQPTSYVQTTSAAVNTLATTCFTEILGWSPVRTSVGHAVVFDVALHEA